MYHLFEDHSDFTSSVVGRREREWHFVASQCCSRSCAREGLLAFDRRREAIDHKRRCESGCYRLERAHQVERQCWATQTVRSGLQSDRQLASGGSTIQLYEGSVYKQQHALQHVYDDSLFSCPTQLWVDDPVPSFPMRNEGSSYKLLSWALQAAETRRRS